MARDCADGRLVANLDPTYYWGPAADMSVRKASPGNYYHFVFSGYGAGTCGVLRYSTTAGNTWILRKNFASPVTGSPVTAESVGTSLAMFTSDGRSASVTDAVLNRGDWIVTRGAEVSFECYDAPAPSGPAHPVIGSGIVNARRIVRGAA